MTLMADGVRQLRIRKEEVLVVESFSVHTNTLHRGAQETRDQLQKEEKAEVKTFTGPKAQM